MTKQYTVPGRNALPGTPIVIKEVFLQFDEDQPNKVGEVGGYYQIRIDNEGSVTFKSPDGKKIFKIFLKKK